MELITPLHIPDYAFPLDYNSRVMLIGSCFTTHLGEQLLRHKFHTLYNHAGVVFDAMGIAAQLQQVIKQEHVPEADFFRHNSLWNHWNYHSDCSHTSRTAAAQQLNQRIENAHRFLQTATHLIITVGTAFSYRLRENDTYVVNCHKMPQADFSKELCSVAAMTTALQQSIDALLHLNPALKIILTVSPVRHLRDGLTENNRSKARVLETVHTLCENNAACSYFPAYELVTDVLRDYRWFAADLAHPTAQAAEYVFHRFSAGSITLPAQETMKQVLQVTTAMLHRPRFADTPEHAQFKKRMLEQVRHLAKALPGIDWNTEFNYFSA